MKQKQSLKYKFFLLLFFIGLVILVIPLPSSDNLDELPLTGDESKLSVEIVASKGDVQQDDPTEGAQGVDYTITVSNEAECIQKPVDVMLVYDKSGSMSSLMDDAVQAGIAFVNNLDFTKDLAGVVTYNDTAQLVQTLTNSETNLTNTINSIFAGGMTNIGDGISYASVELATERHNDSAIPVMIIFTDGRANRPSGVNARQYTIDKATEAKSAGIRVISIAYGRYADVDLMQEVASPGSDNYFWAETGVDMIRIYSAISESLQGDSPDTQLSVDLSYVKDIVELVSSNPVISTTNGELEWYIGNLQCQESAFFEFSINVNSGAQDLDVIDLVANVSNSAGVNAQSPQNAITTVHAPRFDFTKTDNKDTAKPGDNLDYRIFVENLGTGNAYGLSFIDTLPSDYFTINSGSISGGGIFGAGTILWNNSRVGYVLDGSFAPAGSEFGNSLSLGFSGNVDSNLSPGLYMLENTVLLRTTNGYTQEAIDITEVPYAPDLSISKSSSPQVYTYPGGEVSYTLVVTNNGGLDASGVVVIDDFDENNMSVSPDNGFVQDGKSTWMIDEVKAGESKTVTYTALVNDTIEGNNINIPNESTVSSREPDINRSDNIALHEVIATLDPVLTISKSTDKTSYLLGEEVEYTVIIKNDSGSDAYDVILKDSLSTEFDYVRGSALLNGQTVIYPTGTKELVWDLGYLAKDQQAVVTFRVEPNENCTSGNYINTSSVSWENEDDDSFGPQDDDVSFSIIAELSIGDIEPSEETNGNLISDILETATILGRSLVITGEAMICLKVFIGLLLALPLPVMLILDKKNGKPKKKKRMRKKLKTKKKK
ncbi:VWA domain-containing protein [Patescibacteria group bacterium]